MDGPDDGDETAASVDGPDVMRETAAAVDDERPFYMSWPAPTKSEQRLYLAFAPALLMPLILAYAQLSEIERWGWLVSFCFTVLHWGNYRPGSAAQMLDIGYHLLFWLVVLVPRTPWALTLAIGVVGTLDLAYPAVDRHNGAILHVVLRLLAPASVLLRPLFASSTETM